MNTAFKTGVVEGLNKSAWFGTYYHGTSPTAEKAILREGLLTSKGGTGAVAALRKLPIPETQAMADKFSKEVAGKVTMSRSKLLAKVYGTTLDPGTHKYVKDVVHGFKTPRNPKGKFKYLANAIKGGVSRFVEHQPLKIRGVKGLTRDPSHRLLGVQSAKNIPASIITKAKQSRLGKTLLRVLK